MNPTQESCDGEVESHVMQDGIMLTPCRTPAKAMETGKYVHAEKAVPTEDWC